MQTRELRTGAPGRPQRGALRAGVMSGALVISMLAACAAAFGLPGAPPAGHPQHAEDSEHLGRFDALATEPSRPSWAPLALLRADVQAVPFLLEMMKSDRRASRERAAFLLGQVGCPEAIPALVWALADDERSVRIQAAIALGCMGERRGMHGCLAALRGQPDWVRYYAALALWHIQGREMLARPAIVQAMKQALKTASPLVAQAVQGALETPYVEPPAGPELPQASQAGFALSEEEMWEQAADVLIAESDWWFHEGDYDQAIRCSEASLLLDPDHVETYSVIAWLQWSMGRNVNAVGTLHRAIGAAPLDPDSWYALGFHYFNIGELEKAEGPLSQAVALQGDHLAYRAYAHCLDRLGRPRESLKVWEDLLELRPTDGSVIVNRDRVKASMDGK